MRTSLKQSKSLDQTHIWQTPGQAGAKHLLNNFLNFAHAGQTPHAFLFLGPRGVGKVSLALEFAHKLSFSGDSTGSAVASRAEILEFDFAVSGSIQNLRELISFSGLTSIGSKKIFVLKNFDAASLAGSNVLLKTLEEPASSSMFLLVANSNRVLPTVMSRCVAIRCFPVDGAVAPSSLPKNLLAATQSYPTLAAELAGQPDRALMLGEFLSKLQARQLSLVDLTRLIELSGEDLQLLAVLWIGVLKDRLADSARDLPSTVHNLKVAQNFSDDLKRSYNSKLVLQQFLIHTQ